MLTQAHIIYEYLLRAGEPRSASQIAESCEIPRYHVQVKLGQMKRQGLVKSQKLPGQITTYTLA